LGGGHQSARKRNDSGIEERRTTKERGDPIEGRSVSFQEKRVGTYNPQKRVKREKKLGGKGIFRAEGHTYSRGGGFGKFGRGDKERGRKGKHRIAPKFPSRAGLRKEKRKKKSKKGYANK